jgi:hypothetical protein
LRSKIAANSHPHPNLPLEGEGTIALSPVCGGELERGLAPLPQRSFSSNG